MQVSCWVHQMNFEIGEEMFRQQWGDMVVADQNAKSALEVISTGDGDVKDIEALEEADKKYAETKIALLSSIEAHANCFLQSLSYAEAEVWRPPLESLESAKSALRTAENDKRKSDEVLHTLTKSEE